MIKENERKGLTFITVKFPTLFGTKSIPVQVICTYLPDGTEVVGGDQLKRIDDIKSLLKEKYKIQKNSFIARMSSMYFVMCVTMIVTSRFTHPSNGKYLWMSFVFPAITVLIMSGLIILITRTINKIKNRNVSK